MSDGAFRRLAQKVDLELLARFAKADCHGRTGTFDCSAMDWFLERARALGVEHAPPPPLVLGRHLLDLGVTPGPGHGRSAQARSTNGNSTARVAYARRRSRGRERPAAGRDLNLPRRLHHEFCLSDPRRVPAARLRTILASRFARSETLERRHARVIVPYSADHDPFRPVQRWCCPRDVVGDGVGVRAVPGRGRPAPRRARQTTLRSERHVNRPDDDGRRRHPAGARRPRRDCPRQRDQTHAGAGAGVRRLEAARLRAGTSRAHRRRQRARRLLQRRPARHVPVDAGHGRRAAALRAVGEAAPASACSGSTRIPTSTRRRRRAADRSAACPSRSPPDGASPACGSTPDSIRRSPTSTS